MSNYRFICHSDKELMHYGRSKDDGAPGVGTGNWRRKDDYHYADNSLSFKGVSEFRKKAKKYRLKKRKEELARLQRDYDYIQKVKVDKYGKVKPTLGGKLSRFISDRKLARATKKAEAEKAKVEEFTGEEFEKSASKYDADAKISNQQAYDLLNEVCREAIQLVKEQSTHSVTFKDSKPDVDKNGVLRSAPSYSMSDYTKAFWNSKEKVEKLFPNSKDEIYNQFFKVIVDTSYPKANTTITDTDGNMRWSDIQMMAGWKKRSDDFRKRYVTDINDRAHGHVKVKHS